MRSSKVRKCTQVNGSRVWRQLLVIRLMDLWLVIARKEKEPMMSGMEWQCVFVVPLRVETKEAAWSGNGICSLKARHAALRRSMQP